MGLVGLGNPVGEGLTLSKVAFTRKHTYHAPYKPQLFTLMIKFIYYDSPVYILEH
jgi:hypothetical protein